MKVCLKNPPIFANPHSIFPKKSAQVGVVPRIKTLMQLLIAYGLHVFPVAHRKKPLKL